MTQAEPQGMVPRMTGCKRWLMLPALLAFGLWLCGGACLALASEGETGADQAPSLPEPKDPALREAERQALMLCYQALGGPDWLQRDFWGSDRPVGDWHGIETDADGRVVRLTIYDNNLEGSIPPEICRLERLHTLHLSFNKIGGQLPDALGDCHAMKNLWLKGNKLTGCLPDSVAVLPELEYLDLHANALSGPLPERWNTPKLQTFRGEDNSISGGLPDQLLTQPALEQLFLHNNRLTGALPQQLGAKLSALLLFNNALSGPIPEALGRLEDLIDLRLNRNRLSGAVPASLAAAPALQVLRLDDNRLSGPLPAGLGEGLTVFDISSNPELEAAVQ